MIMLLSALINIYLKR